MDDDVYTTCSTCGAILHLDSSALHASWHNRYDIPHDTMPPGTPKGITVEACANELGRYARSYYSASREDLMAMVARWRRGVVR